MRRERCVTGPAGAAGAGPFPADRSPFTAAGWESGTRADALPFCRIVAGAGFACAAVEYRLAPAVQFPPVDDIVAAIAFSEQSWHPK